MTLESPRLRLGIMAIVVVSLFAALLARLWYLQVLAAPQYQTQAEVNRVRTIYTEAPRGRILDRQGHVLVDNRVSDVQKRLDDKRYSPFKPIPVATEVPKETIIYIREHQSDYPGVGGVQLTE